MLIEKLSRQVGLRAASFPLSRLAYSLGARVYSLASGDRSATLRRQINILRALEPVWQGASRYTEAYRSSTYSPRQIDCQSLIAPYDHFFLDVFGTFRKEQEVWPASGRFLRALQEQRKEVVIVSNTADFPPEHTQQQLQAAGLAIDLDRIVTSGQTLKALFRTERLVGKRVLCLGSAAGYAAEAGAEPVSKINSQYAAVVLSFLKKPLPPETVAIVADKVAAAGLPVILANADRLLPRLTGLQENQAFPLAAALAGNGRSRVIEAGKPALSIYEEALGRTTSRPKRILCVGDTLGTDIQGAVNFQAAYPEIRIDSLLVLSGTEKMLYQRPEQLASQLQRTGTFPTYILPQLALAG
jgi:HAD superfamily hydrolase (TIGR01450 family)